MGAGAMSAELDAFHQLELMGKLAAGEAYRPSLAKEGEYSARLTAARKALDLPDAEAAPAGKRKQLSDAEKVRLVREQAAALVKERAPYTERLPLLRSRAQFHGLTLRDAELQALLWDARRRANGSREPISRGQRLNLSPTPWLWEGVLMPGRLNLVVALPKVGKTALVLAWIAAWHHGCQAFLGRPLIGTCPLVLVVGTDQPENDWGAMLKRAGLMDEKEQLSEPFLALFHKGAPLHLDPEGIERIERYAEEHPGLVILLDSIAACTGPLGIDENSPQIAEPIRDLMEAVAPHRATVVAIHHSNKGRAGEAATVASRGSTALPAEASQIISLSKMPTPEGQPDSPRIILRTEGRGGAPSRLLIEQTGDGWICHGEGEEVDRAQRLQKVAGKLQPRQREALELLCQRWSDGCQPTDAKTAAEALKLDGEGDRSAERKARSTLDQLVRDRLALARVETGEEARRKLYTPSPDGLQAVGRAATPLSEQPSQPSQGSQPATNPPSREGREGWEGRTDTGGGEGLEASQPPEPEYESPERLADTERERRRSGYANHGGDGITAAEAEDLEQLHARQLARRLEEDTFTAEAAGEREERPAFGIGARVQVWSQVLRQWRSGWHVDGMPDAEGLIPLRSVDGKKRQHVRPGALRLDRDSGGQSDLPDLAA